MRAFPRASRDMTGMPDNAYYDDNTAPGFKTPAPVASFDTDIFFVLIFATLWAWMEVEIEGKNGWAQKLPTSCAFMGWTWYHVSMNIIVLVVLYRGLRCVQFEQCVWKNVLFFILYSVAWFVVQDLTWFVVNPSYGISKYTVHDIPWHASKPWFGGTFVYNWVVLFCWALAAGLQLVYCNSLRIFRDMCIAGFYVLVLVLCSATHPNMYNSPVVSNSGCYL